jgi:D-beta-D-heptose 7-phosphate kinase/D-beta-D-heptose 1-phosphate adenosyltransferase
MSQRQAAIVVGDPMLDRRIEGTMTKITAEGPAPVVSQKEIIETLGGAANVARNIVTLGGNAHFAGLVGTDYAADRLQQMLSVDCCQSTCLQRVHNGKTTTKTRITCGGQLIIRVDDDASLPDAHSQRLLMHSLDAIHAAGSAGMFVISDYAKGTMSPTNAAYLVGAATIPVFVDAKPKMLRYYAKATLLKINMSEALQIATEDGYLHPGLLVPDSAAEVAAKYIYDKYQFQNVVVTCGDKGAVVVNEQGVRTVPTTPQTVYDVTGAGDVFMAALAVSFMEGTTLDEAVYRANVAAGLSVQQHGTVAINRNDLEDEIAEQRGWASKIRGLIGTLAFYRRKTAAGKSIVLANGCFDALHVGHLQTLLYAKQQGNVLIVACNTDESVQQLKGAGRPLIPLNYRLTQLAMQECVDCVIAFDGNVEALVRQMRPDVLVKGEQNRGTHVPGADYVAAHGGRVAFAPMIPNVSTSEINSRQ